MMPSSNMSCWVDQLAFQGLSHSAAAELSVCIAVCTLRVEKPSIPRLPNTSKASALIEQFLAPRGNLSDYLSFALKHYAEPFLMPTSVALICCIAFW